MSILTRLFLIAAMAFSLPTVAQSDSAIYARLVFITPHKRYEKEFEEGYQKHLMWHKYKNDTWTWYGWTIASGDHVGEFMDGTFFRTWRELDNPVDPAGDAKDNRDKVSPYADFRSVVTLKYLPKCSNSKGHPLHAKWLKIYQIEGRPGKEYSTKLSLALLPNAYNQSLYTFEVVDGDAIPSYYVLIPYESNESLQKVHDLIYSKFYYGNDQNSPEIRRVRANTYRFRPEMSLLGNKP